MAAADVAFAQADTNRDQRLDINEFQNFLGSSSGLTGTSSYTTGGDLSGMTTMAGQGSSTFTTSTTGDALAGNTGFSGAGFDSVGYGASSYGASTGNLGTDFSGVSGATGGLTTDLSTANYTSSVETAGFQQYATDAQGLFRDSNPQIVRRPAPGGGVTYTQNIRVRFLQPPPIPPPGPLIIREVRPPQPPVPPPLRIRQQAPPLPQPPPLVLRERPPVPPASVASQTVIRRLAAIPVPPRSVIIERIPPAPARPRDIIIERWIPYGAAAKRRTIVQRAAAARAYAPPRNIIIQYEAPHVRIIRRFQNLGITQENPQAYVQRYGGMLLDSMSLVQQARAAGVVEDISPSAVAGAANFHASQFTGSTGGFGLDTIGLAGGVTGFDSSSSYGSSSHLAGTDMSGFGTATTGFTDAGVTGLAGSSTYESSSSYGTSTGTHGTGADAAFMTADTNRDGVLSQGEFRAAGF